MWRLTKEWLRFLIGDWFQIHRNERDGYIAWAVALLAVIIAVNWALPYCQHPRIPQVDSVRLERAYQRLREQTQIRIIHPFDPNRVNADWLVLMNIHPPLARRWENFLKKGGRFRRPEDLLRLYGMDSATWKALLPALIFTAPASTPKSVLDRPTSVKPSLPQQDLNQAPDSMLAQVVPPWLARRIIKYRSLLGGFVRWKQLEEVYGMHARYLQRLQRRFYLPDTPLRWIRINRDSYYRLRRHPYITDSMAHALAQRRRWKGAFDAVEQLHEIWDSSVIRRLYPYLRME